MLQSSNGGVPWQEKHFRQAKAPDFKFHSTPDQEVTLADFGGDPLILAFYPADWSPVCGDQMALYNEVLSEFKKHGANGTPALFINGVRHDGPWDLRSLLAAIELVTARVARRMKRSNRIASSV